MIFWLIILCFLLAAVWFALQPLIGKSVMEAGDGKDENLYIDELRNIDLRLKNGPSDNLPLQEERAEIARRLLRLNRTSTKTDSVQETNPFALKIASVTAVLLIPIISLALYFGLGSLGMVDRPFEAKNEKPLQERSIEEMVQMAKAHLQENPDDIKGWVVLAGVYKRLGRHADRTSALLELVRLSPPDADTLAELGEAVTLANGNIVSAKARLYFQNSVSIAPNAKAEFFLAVSDEQEGKFAQALPRWKSLGQMRKDDTQWQAMIAGRIKNAQDKLNAKFSGPDSEQVKAAIALPQQDRQKMIQGMVDGLADRLESEPDDFDGWLRLIRSYAVFRCPKSLLLHLRKLGSNLQVTLKSWLSCRRWKHLSKVHRQKE